MAFRRLTSLAATLAAAFLFGGHAQEFASRNAQQEARSPAACEAPYPVGFRTVQAAVGLRMALWYPTADPVAPFQYARQIAGRVAKDGAPAACGRLPLVLFSHGFAACGLQSIFFTEELARRGYMVAAPDHQDAVCSVEGREHIGFRNPYEPFRRPEMWSEISFANRKEDLALAIRWLLASSEFGKLIDADRIGVAGHSLGGYTVFGLAGGWESWRDARIKGVLLFSPYLHPFLKQGRVASVHVPVMYQGATGDFFITPFLRGARGAYGASNAPKFFVELERGGHFAWTNGLCVGKESIAACLAASSNAELIDEYGIAFLDAYLKGQPDALRRLNGAGLAGYQYAGRP